MEENRAFNNRDGYQKTLFLWRKNQSSMMEGHAHVFMQEKTSSDMEGEPPFTEHTARPRNPQPQDRRRRPRTPEGAGKESAPLMFFAAGYSGDDAVGIHRNGYGLYQNRLDGPFPKSAGGCYRGTSLIRKRPPPRTHHRALCIVLLQGPRRALFLMSEVPLYTTSDGRLLQTS